MKGSYLTDVTDISRVFLDESCRLLGTEYISSIERCLAELSDEDIWWRANETSNSIGNLLLHLRGNVGQWIVGGVGQRANDRKRQQEFDERAHIPKRELLTNLKATVAEAVAVIRAVNPESLLDGRVIQGYDTTVFKAIYHVVEHFSTHTGQIVLLTKLRAGKDLRLWQPSE